MGIRSPNLRVASLLAYLEGRSLDLRREASRPPGLGDFLKTPAYVDRNSGPAPAVVGRGHGAADAGARGVVVHPDECRYLPRYRPAGGGRGVELSWLVGGRYGAPGRDYRRTRLRQRR